MPTTPGNVTSRSFPVMTSRCHKIKEWAMAASFSTLPRTETRGKASKGFSSWLAARDCFPLHIAVASRLSQWTGYAQKLARKAQELEVDVCQCVNGRSWGHSRDKNQQNGVLCDISTSEAQCAASRPDLRRERSLRGLAMSSSWKQQV